MNLQIIIVLNQSFVAYSIQIGNLRHHDRISRKTKLIIFFSQVILSKHLITYYLIPLFRFIHPYLPYPGSFLTNVITCAAHGRLRCKNVFVLTTLCVTSGNWNSDILINSDLTTTSVLFHSGFTARIIPLQNVLTHVAQHTLSLLIQSICVWTKSHLLKPHICSNPFSPSLFLPLTLSLSIYLYASIYISICLSAYLFSICNV